MNEKEKYTVYCHMCKGKHTLEKGVCKNSRAMSPAVHEINTSEASF